MAQRNEQISNSAKVINHKENGRDSERTTFPGSKDQKSNTQPY